jgi:hypothetical protein
MADASSAMGGFSSAMGGVSSIVGAGTAIAQTIAGINDMNKRRQTETALSYLTAQQQAELNQQLAAAQTQTDRMQILSNAVVQYAIANQASKNRQQSSMYIVAALMGIALLISAIYLMKQKD